MDLSGISNKNSLILNTKTLFNFSSHKANSQEFVANLHKINDFRRINKYLKTVNSTLKTGGIFLGKAETLKQRKRAIMLKYPPVISNVICIFDFLLNRIFPKLTFFKAIYFFLTKGKNRPLSKCEILGRLVFCGFELINITEIEDELYFIVKKIGKPSKDENPSYSPIIALKRRGKNNEYIYLHKFRTMHPYAEYLHDFLATHFGYESNGKLKNDFRKPKWAKFLRATWLDELPQLINVLKGEMGLVGVRAFSDEYLKNYPDELKKERAKYKPGCIPTYISLNLDNGHEDRIKSEYIYFKDKEKHPFLTDIRYFFKAVFNILTRKIKTG
jgi:lipopolysaccharide/colanic/teichoic acid biosynthesis glycosyltransferase